MNVNGGIRLLRVPLFFLRGENDMERLGAIISAVDAFVWGPVMLILLVGTGI